MDTEPQIVGYYSGVRMRERERPLAIARDNYRNHLQRRFLKAWIRFNQTSSRSLCALLNRGAITSDPKQRWSCLWREKCDQRIIEFSLPFINPSSEWRSVSGSSAGINGWIRAGPWKPYDNLLLKFSREYRAGNICPHIIVPITETHYREMSDTCRLRGTLAT